MTIPNISLTENAANQVAHLIDLEKSEKPLFLRVSVTGGGCSGFQYHFTLDDTKTPDDYTVEKGSVSVVIDAVSIGLLSDAVIDYTQDLTSSQFVIKNPNATSSCGCGNSFAI